MQQLLQSQSEENESLVKKLGKVQELVTENEALSAALMNKKRECEQ